jgi:tetratricopeptide (TPR) repeat protein
VNAPRLSILAVVLAASAACGRAPARPPVVVIGWDGADWDYLQERMASGGMPGLAALVKEGTSGSLRTLHPPLSPIVWTTMMTGRDPLAHGILDFTRYEPTTRAREPITSDERRVPAVWTIASSAGRAVAVFGLWATYPAESVNGVVVSDRFLSFQNGAGTGDRGLVFPEERAAWARGALERAEAEVSVDAVRAFAPGIGTETRLHEGLRRILVETRVYDELAATWFREQRPDLTILYVQGTDAIGHLFAPYRPPRAPGVSDEQVSRLGGVADRFYDEVDRRLGAWRKAARDAGAVLVLVSDHGFAWGEDRPRAGGSAAAATAGRWHREEGIYVAAGPGIAPSPARAGHGEVAQVAPTVLALLGIPTGRGMPDPLPGMATARGAAVDYAAAAPGPGPAPAIRDGNGNDEAIANLRALGYVGGSEPDRAPAGSPAETRTAGSFGNEGLILEERGRSAEAEQAFERALAIDPGHAASLWNLSRLLAGRPGAPSPRAEQLLSRALAAGSPDAAHALLDRARSRMRAGDCRGALADAGAVEAADAASPIAPAVSGLALLCLGDGRGATQALERSLALDPDQPEIRGALASLR